MNKNIESNIRNTPDFYVRAFILFMGGKMFRVEYQLQENQLIFPYEFWMAFRPTQFEWYFVDFVEMHPSQSCLDSCVVDCCGLNRNY